MPEGPGPEVERLVAHLFRRSAGRMVAALTRVLGPGRLDLAENVVQDALVKALQVWPYSGIPANPEGWLFRVGRNRAVDLLRGQEVRGRHHDAMAGSDDWGPFGCPADSVSLEVLDDDELSMIFMCCHPGIPSEARLALTLRTVGGFSTDEIASAFLGKRASIQQRIVRAKRRIRERSLSFALPTPDTLVERLESVLTVLYLMFNEGYNASRGDSVVRGELCREAIRLGGVLLEREETARPQTHALMALMLLHASRLPARTGAPHTLVLLEDQDRSAWDDSLATRGLRHLERAASGDRLTPYHLEAGIAAEHATSPSWGDTNWARILKYYDQLLALAPSPVVALNRAVALAMVQGPVAGLAALEPLEDSLADYYLLYAVRAELLVRAGQPERALSTYQRAVLLAGARPERPWLVHRQQLCAVLGAHSSGEGAGRP